METCVPANHNRAMGFTDLLKNAIDSGKVILDISQGKKK